MIVAGVSSAVGLAIAIVVLIFAYRIKNDLHDQAEKRAIADSVRWEGRIAGLEQSIRARDSVALVTSRAFESQRDRYYLQPIVTGGGKKADSIANAAVKACYEKATDALTACQKARLTADSLPAMKDSLTNARIRIAKLAASPRWTASGFVGYVWPLNTPAIGAESDLRLTIPIVRSQFSINARADAIPFFRPATHADSLAYGTGKWRATASVKIPFR